MSIKVALAGNPNCGKTTLFNCLTGSNQFVGNWPGVTVEKKEGKLRNNKEITITDLPGIYSLSPYTLEEVVARNYLIEERPDIILNIIDGTNLERSLYLTTQLLELGIPTILAINMLDLLEKRNTKINVTKLSDELGCNIIEISALKNKGIENIINAISNIDTNNSFIPIHSFDNPIEESLRQIEDCILDVPNEIKRFYAIKLFERDEKLSPIIKCSGNIEVLISKIESKYEDDSESIITNERYNFISQVVDKCQKKNKAHEKLSVSDKIDKIVTNKWLGLPIFAIIMFLVYFISVTTVGAIVTDFTNDTLFGEWVLPAANKFLTTIGCADWLIGLIVNGIIGGVGAVLGFVPQMLILFLFLAFLEACGYMARVAFIMDRVFSKFGLSGKSFIPILIGTGCGVPGIMASRTIENDRDRKMTIMTTTFIPCGAKLPIIALIAGSLFNKSPWVAPSAYFIGILAILCSGIILKKTKPFAGNPAPFVMELPEYHMPTALNVLRSMWERSWSFIKKAGTVILLSTIVVWFLSSFSLKGGFHMINDTLEQDTTILANIGNLISWIFIPLGFGDWRSTVATITGLIAKENVVGTFGILYGFSEVSEDGQEIWNVLSNAYTPAAAYSLLVFNLLCAPCFAAIGAIKREMNNKKWFWAAIGYQTLLAYIVSFCIYQIWTLVTTGNYMFFTLISFILIIIVLYLLFKPNKSKHITHTIKQKKHIHA